MIAHSDISAGIEKGVHDSHGRVVEAFLDELDGRLTSTIVAMRTGCSYQASQRDYVSHKLTIHHCRKILDRVIREEVARYDHRIMQAERQLREIRADRYSKVCAVCPACLSRKKPWPAHTNFKTPGIQLQTRNAVNAYVTTADQNTLTNKTLTLGDMHFGHIEARILAQTREHYFADEGVTRMYTDAELEARGYRVNYPDRVKRGWDTEKLRESLKPFYMRSPTARITAQEPEMQDFPPWAEKH